MTTGSALMLLIWATTGVNAAAAATIVAAVLVVELAWEHFHHWLVAVRLASEVPGD